MQASLCGVMAESTGGYGHKAKWMAWATTHGVMGGSTMAITKTIESMDMVNYTSQMVKLMRATGSKGNSTESVYIQARKDYGRMESGSIGSVIQRFKTSKMVQ